MRKKIIACIMALAIAVAFMPTSAFAGSKIKMTAYDQVYVSGKTAYCAGARGLYKVTLKKGKVKKVKVLFSAGRAEYPEAQVFSMKKKGKYIYFLRMMNDGTWLYRVNTSGKNKKLLVYQCCDYAIKGKKIYYEQYWEDHNKKYVMKLNGKNKKRTSTYARLKTKRSNKSGYKMYSRVKGSYVQDFLITPKGKFYLGRVYLMDWDDE